MILVPISGGIDSTALLWLYRDRPVVSFHLTLGLSRPEEQEVAELIASRRVVDYLRSHGAELEYEEFSHEVDDPMRRIPPRLAIVAYTGLMLRQCPEISMVGNGGIAIDLTRPWVPRLVPAGKKIIALLAGRDDFKVVAPFIEFTKSEVKATLPPELLAMTFSCFEPVRDGAEWAPCGKCMKCEEARG